MEARGEADRTSFWRLATVCGGVAVIASLLPSLRIEVGGYLGAGASQQVFAFSREINLAWGSLPWSVLFLIGALLVVGLAQLGNRGASPAPVIAGILALAVIAIIVIGTVNANGSLRPWDPFPSNASHSCSAQGGETEAEGANCGGVLLDPAVSALQRDSEAGSSATISAGYHLDSLIGWIAYELAVLILIYVGSYQLLRLRFQPSASILLLFGATLLVFLVLAGEAIDHNQ